MFEYSFRLIVEAKKKILLNLMLYLPAHLIFKINKIMLVWQGHILFPANILLLMITFTFSSNLDLIVLCSLKVVGQSKL